MDFGSVLAHPPWEALGGAVSAGLVGLASTFEVYWPFRDIDGLSRYCKRPLLGSFGAFIFYGAGAYMLVSAGMAAGLFHIAGQENWVWKGVIAASFSQALRLDVLPKGSLRGSVAPKTSGGSVYLRALGIAKCRVYKRLISKSPKDDKLARLMSAGLQEVYTLDETFQAFDKWLKNKCPADKRDDMKTLRQNAANATKATLVKRAGMLWSGMAETGPQTAVEYASERASDIVELDALRKTKPKAVRRANV